MFVDKKYHTTLECVILYNITYHNTPGYIINMTYLTLNVKMKKKFAFTVHIHIPVINVYYGTDNFHCNSTNIVNKYFVELKITYICCVFQQHDDTSLDMKLYGFLLNKCDRRKLK